MIEGWKTEMNISVGEVFKDKMLELEAEPNFAEIGEKVRSLTAELHEKILNQELKWSLMMTPMKLVKDLQMMCEAELERRKEEIKDLKDEMQ